MKQFEKTFDFVRTAESFLVGMQIQLHGKPKFRELEKKVTFAIANLRMSRTIVVLDELTRIFTRLQEVKSQLEDIAGLEHASMQVVIALNQLQKTIDVIKVRGAWENRD